MKTVLVVANPRKERALKLAEETGQSLSADCRVILDSSTESLENQTADFAVVFGGDGTVLDTVRRLGENQIPLITVNLGRLGFLAEVPPEGLPEMLKKAIAGRWRISERMLLDIEVRSSEKIIWKGRAFNEAAFLPHGRGRLCHVSMEVDGAHIADLSGDGVIASTPTGSTGYALSAGGPVLNPELKALLLVPVCPHRLSSRPLVLGEEEKLQISGRTDLYVDGQEVASLQKGDYAVITCSQKSVKLVLGESLGRYDILQQKLGWAVVATKNQ